MTDIYSSQAHRILLIDLHPYSVESAAVVNRYIASEGYHTEPTDSPANTTYLGLLSEGSDLTFSREMFGGDMLRGRSIPDSGALTIINVKRAGFSQATLADWVNPTKYTWDGRAIQAYLLVKGESYSAKTKVLEGIIDDIEFDELTITFRLRSKAYLFEEPVQTAEYGGTGGVDGGSELTGKKVPRLFGRKKQVPGVLLNYANLIYQFCDEVQAFDEIRSGGVFITQDADVADYTTLAAASVAAGHCQTCKAEGLAKFGTAPAGLVTADIQGSKLSGTYSGKAADIMKFVAEEVSGVTADSAAITALNALNGSEVSFYAGLDPVMRSVVLDSVANDIGGWWGFNRAGEFDCGRLDVPGTSALSLTQSNIAQNGIARSVVGRPIWKLGFNYQTREAVQSADDLAGSITQDKVALYTKPYLSVAPAETASVLTVNASAIEYTFTTSLYDSTAAGTERDRLHTLWKTRRDQFTLQTNLKPLQVEMGQTFTMTYPAFGLDSGEDMVVFGFTESYLSGKVSLKAFK